MKRRKITDLAATGHPKECARLILEYRKSKYTKQEGHKTAIHIIPEEGIIQIDVKEDNTQIFMEIPKNIAINQAHEILGISPESSQN